MKRYNKIAAELVVSPREVLEVRPRSSPPPSMQETQDHEPPSEREDEWDNSPCTD